MVNGSAFSGEEVQQVSRGRTKPGEQWNRREQLGKVGLFRPRSEEMMRRVNTGHARHEAIWTQLLGDRRTSRRAALHVRTQCCALPCTSSFAAEQTVYRRRCVGSRERPSAPSVAGACPRSRRKSKRAQLRLEAKQEGLGKRRVPREWAMIRCRADGRSVA
jgi:hypothetical protein